LSDDTPNGAVLRARTVPELRGALADARASANVRHVDTGQTALMAAVLGGRRDLVEFLLDDEAVDAGLGDKDGYTPVHGAGFQGRAEIMGLLHRRGWDVNRVHEGDGYRPIHRACWGREARHHETVRYLVEEAGVPFDVPSSGRHPRQTCLDMTPNAQTRAWLLELRAAAGPANPTSAERDHVEL
jgi:ankyrin repeat protein